MGMGRSHKQPKNTINPTPEKKAKSRAIPQSPENILWSFSILDRAGPFGVHLCESVEKLVEVLHKKREFEGMTWSDIHRGGSHEIEPDSLCKEAKDRLIEIDMDDVDALLSLRLTGKNRLWCVREENILRVLWWDPDHLVCPSKKKHT